jgi:hypothetical protein
METPVIQANIDRLRSDVDQYSDNKSYLPMGLFNGIDVSFSKVYIALPVVVLLLLGYTRPDFVKYDYEEENGDVSRKVSIKKIFLCWFVISMVLMVGFFGYSYKMANQGY